MALLHFIGFCLIFLNVKSTTASKISADLISRFEKGETPNILISFVEGTDKALTELSSFRSTIPGAQSQAVYKTLLKNSEKSQSGVESMLSTTRSSTPQLQYKKFWITNQMWVQGADLKLVQNLAEHPNVKRIDKEPVYKIPEEDSEEALRAREIVVGVSGEPQWNLKRIGAPEAWEEIGSKGEGVIVGMMDTGARLNHEALRDNFLGEYGYLDPIRNTTEPFSDFFHGSHVLGIAVGSQGIGVAPGAKWSTCRTSHIGHIESYAILACGEFFVCPTLTDGSNMDCSKAPNVIINSWGGDENEKDANMIKAWRSAGIIPVFAIGNERDCRSTSFPGNLDNVIAVGQVNMNDTSVNVKSSRGPTSDGRIKPDICAPGSNILSVAGEEHFSNNSYRYTSGTSMACPHVAGVIALLFVRERNLTFERITEYLYNSTDQNLKNVWQPNGGIGGIFPGETCGSVKNMSLIWPNNHYGHGLVHAFKAVKAQSIALSTSHS